MSRDKSAGHLEWVRYEVLDSARRLLNGDVTLIEGSVGLAPFSDEFDSPLTELFTIFVVISSESDALPLPNVRQHWSKEALVDADRRISELEAAYGPMAYEACRELIRHLTIVKDEESEDS